MATQKPTVGRIVHYYEDEASAPIMAFITGVKGYGVTLYVLPPGGTPHEVTGSRHSDEPKGKCWSWPPRDEPTTSKQPDESGGKGGGTSKG